MNDPQRSKAAAMFGKTFMDAAKPTPPAKNYATAQQKVANSRPIPTYKVGGPVKKAMGGEARKREADKISAEITARDQESTRRSTDYIPTYDKDGKYREIRGRGEKPTKLEAMEFMDAAGRLKRSGNNLRIPKEMRDLAAKGSAEAGMRESASSSQKGSGRVMKKAMGGEAKMFDEAVAAMPSPVMRAVGGAGKTRKGQAPIKRAQGGPVKDGSKKDAEYGDYVAGEKDRKPVKPVKKAMGGVGKMRHNVPMKGVKPHKGIGV